MSPTSHTETRAAPLRVDYEMFLRLLVFVCVLTGVFVDVEPSPYDITSLVAMLFWFIGGFTIHRSLIFNFLLMGLFNLSGFIALMPYWNEPTPRLYQFQSLYLLTTYFFFALYCSERTKARLESILTAYTIGAVVSSILGLLSYVDAFGLGFLMPYEGRVAGTFKDPNLFGSYLVLAANVLLQKLIASERRISPLVAASFVIVVAGIFFSFSRGSWGATAVSLLLVVVSTYVTTSSDRLRRRIAIVSVVLALVMLVAVAIALATPDVGGFLLQRFKLAQDYDEGATGRFGNQLRSIPMLLDRFWGFGPLRFRLVFALEPHNSFLGAFANDGWIGGFTWIVSTLATGFVGFRLMFVASPVRQLAQIVWPALFVFYMQGFQIDIDHWRQLWLCLGAVWALEAARQRWLYRCRQAARRTPPMGSSLPGTMVEAAIGRPRS